MSTTMLNFKSILVIRTIKDVIDQLFGKQSFVKHFSKVYKLMASKFIHRNICHNLSTSQIMKQMTLLNVITVICNWCKDHLSTTTTSCKDKTE